MVGSSSRWCLPILLLAVAHSAKAHNSAATCTAESCGRGLGEESVLLQHPVDRKASLSTVAASVKVAGPSNATGSAPHKHAAAGPAATSASTGKSVLIFVSASALTAGVLTLLYWSKGVVTICKVLAYIAALASIRFTVKAVQDTNKFSFPLFLTMTHFVCSAGLALLLMQLWQDKIRWPTMIEWFTRFVPIAGAHAISVAVSNMALLYGTASFVEIVGATTPIVTVGVVILMGQPFNTMLLGPLAMIIVGTGISSEGEKAFSMLGMVLAFSGNVFRAVKAALQQVLMVKQEDGSVAFKPLEVLAFTCLPCSCIMGVWSLVVEGLAPPKMLATASSSLLGAIVVSIAMAMCLNLAVLYVIKELGAVGTQLVGQAKTLLVVLGSMAIFGDQVTPVEAGGFGLVMFGVWSYNYLDTGFKRAAAEKNEKGDLIKKAQGEVTQASCTSEPR